MKRTIIFLACLLNAPLNHAITWSDLWFNQDQKGQALMTKGQFSEAETTFARKDWIASAAYRAGNYERAAILFEGLQSKDGYYNQGNALAHLGRYEEAIRAYDRALDIDPDDKDVLYNRKLIEELMKQDKAKQENKNVDSQQENKDQQNKDQQNKDQQNKDQQNKDQQNKDQQNKDQQNKDQQNKDQENKDQENKDQQNKDQQNKDQQNKNQQNKTKDDVEQSQQDKEKQQAKEQWLRLIPDDPGGLMREKFLRDHLRRQRGWYQ